MLRYQLPKARRRHPEVDVGWSIFVEPRKIALELVLALLSGQHGGPVGVVVYAFGVGESELNLGARDRLAVTSGQHLTGQHVAGIDAGAYRRVRYVVRAQHLGWRRLASPRLSGRAGCLEASAICPLSIDTGDLVDYLLGGLSSLGGRFFVGRRLGIGRGSSCRRGRAVSGLTPRCRRFTTNVGELGDDFLGVLPTTTG